MLKTSNAGGLVKSQSPWEGNSMKIKLTRNTVVKGKPRSEGEIIDEVPEAEAHLLVGMKKAVWVDEPKVETTDLKTDEIETRDEPKAPRKKKG